MALDLRIEHEPDIMGGVFVKGFIGDLMVGHLWLTGAWGHLDGGRFVRMVKVDDEYQRQGVATALWDYAVAQGLKPIHELAKTEDGKKWSMTTKQ